MKVAAETQALILRAIEKKEALHASPTMEVKGGYRVSLDGGMDKVRAFLPKRLSCLGQFDAVKLFKSIPVRVTEFQEDRGSVVVSARDALITYIYEEEHRLVSSLEIGQEVKGKVQSLVDFGAFIRIGSIDGLLHKSKIVTPLKKGQEVLVKIAGIDVIRHEVSLEMDMPTEKRKVPKPWKPEKEEVVHVETMSARALREHFCSMNPISQKVEKEILAALRKRNDCGVRNILSGNADWMSAFEGVCR